MAELIDFVPKITIPEYGDQEEYRQKFLAWCRNAKPGEKFCYYFGQYVAGKNIGRDAYHEYERGNVVLYQQRKGKQFAYLAEKRGE